jgi:hypothetical protein
MFILIIFRDFQTIKYIMLRPFPFYIQADSKDYGSTCLKIFANHFGKILKTNCHIKTVKINSKNRKIVKISSLNL